MSRLSAVIITYNEEENIERCITSLESVTDEILVVDSNSTDKTVQIAKKHGASIISRHFLGYIEQKNFAIEKASFGWILSLDADEALDETLLSTVKQLKPKLERGKAYEINRLTNFCGKWIKHAGWHPDRKIRLWHREEGKWGGGGLHETVTLKKHVSTKRLAGILLHYSYSSINQHLDQIKKFSDIAAAQAVKKGKKAGFIKIVLYPFFFFMKRYLFKLGFLDGFYGFVVCANSAYAKMLKHIKIRELHLRSKA